MFLVTPPTYAAHIILKPSPLLKFQKIVLAACDTAVAVYPAVRFRTVAVQGPATADNPLAGFLQVACRNFEAEEGFLPDGKVQVITRKPNKLLTRPTKGFCFWIPSGCSDVFSIAMQLVLFQTESSTAPPPLPTAAKPASPLMRRQETAAPAMTAPSPPGARRPSVPFTPKTAPPMPARLSPQQNVPPPPPNRPPPPAAAKGGAGVHPALPPGRSVPPPPKLNASTAGEGPTRSVSVGSNLSEAGGSVASLSLGPAKGSPAPRRLSAAAAPGTGTAPTLFSGRAVPPPPPRRGPPVRESSTASLAEALAPPAVSSPAPSAPAGLVPPPPPPTRQAPSPQAGRKPPPPPPARPKDTSFSPAAPSAGPPPRTIPTPPTARTQRPGPTAGEPSEPPTTEGRWKFHSPEEFPPPPKALPGRRVYPSGSTIGTCK
ncbi:MAG: hypothetical protein BJ554DRAFT_7486 [Olpidium bornovanus]|uniref:Uncharacterized protein n=1 Tax=Olpidium bornovanus TaxID=278681 RepID=A0A8H8DJ82_9FUNG|nr:MAG: hypothetical protein BJ554DRAFT_7486 [Olpidium bornovanus]